MNRLSRSCWLLLVWSLFATVSIAQAGAQKPPHIVYIVSDDIGWRDVGFHGAKDVTTPNLDRLAQEGARMEQFYAQPFCTPTRAALLTGRYPMRYGLQTVVIPSKGTYGLPLDERVLPQVLKDAGYRTTMIGKWHLGHADRAFWPRQRGFDYHYGAVLGEIDYFTREAHGVLDWQRDNQEVREAGYVTELLGKDAVALIEKHDAKQPLFLYLAFTAPHAPYQAPEEYVAKFAHIAEPTRRTYAAMISCMDTQIGKVVQALRDKGMHDDTLIVWHSDNGGTKSKRFAGEGDVSKVVIPCDNGDLRGGKGELYEGGTRVPAFVRWPGRVPAGTVIQEPVHIVDMLPTLAAAVGTPVGAQKPLDGMSVLPAWTKGASTGRTEVVYNIEPFGAALRQGPWKLVWKAVLPAKVELFHLGDDPNETRDLAAAEPERVKALQARIQVLAAEAAPPKFLQASLDAVYGGLFGPAPIPMGDDR